MKVPAVRRTWVAVAATIGLLGLPVIAADSAGAAPSAEAGPAGRGDLQPVDSTITTDAPTRGAQLRVFGSGDAPETYLIRLAGDAVPNYTGGEPGLAPTTPAPGDQLDPTAAPVRAYRDHLVAEQAGFVERLERTAGRPIEVPFTYQHAVNGIAAVLTADEARAIADDPAVISIRPDQVREIQTDAGPSWQGSDTLWNSGTEFGEIAEDDGGLKGEGVVIGTIDTGISPGNRSFAPTGDDGYTVTNPLGDGNYVGVCNPAEPSYDPAFPCNSKLIGAWVFGGLSSTAVDYDSHGSHTASTSGGNVVNDVTVSTDSITTPPFDISGVAPHANVISYLGCCNVSGLTASIEQAIIDEVDVINYSIGSDAPSALWDDFDSLGFLAARNAGIFVATSNGNAGPGGATTGSPADAPWITSVGASTHNRYNANALTNLTSDAGPLGDLVGKSVTGPLATPTEIVSAAAVGDPLCQATSGNEAAFTGKIVICVRGVNGRIEKSYNVAEQGAVGFVLINDTVHLDSLVSDQYALPGVFLGYTAGQQLLAWLGTGTTHTATIAGTTFTTDDQYGDVIASFSSRGPNRAVDTIVPSVTAPGVDILAAVASGDALGYAEDEHGFISGTSMASPHVAGAGALLTQARPDWSPAQQQSALMTTATPTVSDFTGGVADPYTQGSGRIDVGLAAHAGLLFDETGADYAAANPDEGGDPKTLNLPSFANSQCLATCSWTRTATTPINASSPVPNDVTWTAAVVADDGLVVDVALSQAVMSPGDEMEIVVTADVLGATEGETYFARITLTPSNPAVPTVTMPLAVVPSAGILPDAAAITTRRNAGSEAVSGIESLAISEFTGSVLGLAPGVDHEGSLVTDPTNGDPFDDLSQVDVVNVDVADGATQLIALISDATMPDADLFVGTGATPSAATQVCASTSSGSSERCDIADPAAGTWWVVVQNWDGTEGQADTYTLTTAVVPGVSLGNAGIDGPDGPLPAGTPYDVIVHWNVPEMVAGQTWYGTAVLGSSPATPGDIGTFPISIERVADDVTKVASVAEATIGEPIAYDITVQPNVTPVDLTYTIVDTVPDGLTIDPSTVTGDGVVDGQTITWTVPMPSTVGLVGSYVSSTPATSSQCAAWGGFLDLASVGIPLVTGLPDDTAGVNAFSSIGPFEQYGGSYPNLTVSEDGFVTVAGGYGGAPWTPQAIPQAVAPNGVFAPLWADLQMSDEFGRGLRLATSSGVGAAVVQWEHLFEYGNDPSDLANSVGTFQAWIYNSVSPDRPEVTFEYADLGALPITATVGIENLAGDLATALVGAGDPASVLTSGGTICLDYEAPSVEPVTVSYGVVVDDDVATGTYSNEAVHITDDPYAQPVTASASVEVTGYVPPPCTRTISGFKLGAVNVTSGVTCIKGATIVGAIKVSEGAGLRVQGSIVLGSVKATKAAEVTICSTAMHGTLDLKNTTRVTIGDPANGCGPNLIGGAVKVTGGTGPSVISGNGIIGSLQCSSNDPPPTNNGVRNLVTGQKKGQCAKL